MESNFAFLHRHDPRLAQLGARAEANFTDDPNTCIVKLRQFAETLVKHVAATTKAPRGVDESISDWTRRLVARGTMNDTAVAPPPTRTRPALKLSSARIRSFMSS